MKKLLSILLAALMIASCLVGCGSKSSEPSAENASGDSPRILQAALASAASTTDPFYHANLIERAWQGNVFEPLFHYNASTGGFDPYVGESFTISEDGKTYTVKIKENVKFHNGDPCTADDILYSIEYARNCSFNKTYSGCIESAKKIDDYTVEIALSDPSVVFSNNMGRIFVLNKNVVEEQGEDFGKIANLAGTGPFYIESYEPDSVVKLRAFDDYHEGRAAIDGIDFNVITDDSSRLLALESGQLDIIEVPESNWTEVESSGNFETVKAETSNAFFVMINSKANEVLGNKLVRQAIGYAINYDAVIQNGANGMGVFNGKMMNPSMTIAAPKDGIIYTYNVEKAKELLAEAGYPDGVNIGCMKVPNVGSLVKGAQIFESCMKDIGITVTLEVGEVAAVVDAFRNNNYDLGIVSNYNQVDYDLLSMLINDVENTGGSLVKIKDADSFDWERICELFAEGRLTSDNAERLEIYRELDDILMDAAVALPLYHGVSGFAWTKDLTVEETHPTYTYQLQWYYNAHFNN